MTTSHKTKWREARMSMKNQDVMTIYHQDGTTTEIEHPFSALLDKTAPAGDEIYSRAEAAEAKVAELEAAQAWVLVSERLPEINQNVLLYDSWNDKVTNGELRRISYDDEAIQENIYEWATDGCYFHGGNFERITHWMPLPKPPKEELK